MRPTAIASFQARPANAPMPAMSVVLNNDLQAAHPENRSSHAPEQCRLELETDEEQHHDDAKLGEMHDVLAFFAD